MKAPPKKALITGIKGQDGSYLAELLLEQGYEVHGFVRHADIEAPEQRLKRLFHILPSITLHPISLNYASIFKPIRDVQPSECYHLAAQSFVNVSYDCELETLNTNIMGTHAVLAAVKDFAPDCKIYFAGSSEMFGNVKVHPQNESTAFYPRSAYGISKVAGYELARNFRESHGMFVSSGILYNHESPRRPHEFVTRKITHHAALIKSSKASELQLGNLDAVRDWGHAKDFVRAMWLMLQQDQPDDFVIATGKTHSVRDFVDIAFSHAGLDYKKYVTTNPKYYRPTEKIPLVGDSRKAQKTLGWRPETSFEELVIEMVENDLNLLGPSNSR